MDLYQGPSAIGGQLKTSAIPEGERKESREEKKGVEIRENKGVPASDPIKVSFDRQSTPKESELS